MKKKNGKRLYLQKCRLGHEGCCVLNILWIFGKIAYIIMIDSLSF